MGQNYDSVLGEDHVHLQDIRTNFHRIGEGVRGILWP